MHRRQMTNRRPFAVMYKAELSSGFLLENNVRKYVATNSCCNLDLRVANSYFVAQTRAKSKSCHVRADCYDSGTMFFLIVDS